MIIPMDRFSVVLEKLPHHPRRRGQALIEFAMLAPLIFFLFISVADAGFCSVAAIGVQNAARVGALYTSSSSSAATDSAGACDVVRQELQALPNFSGSNSACSSAPLGHSDYRQLSVSTQVSITALKPNLVEFTVDAPINTHPRVVHAALEAFRSLGAASVRVGEGSGHRRGSLDMADAAGYLDEIPGFEKLFTDLNFDEVTRVRLARPAIDLDSLYLPNTVLASDLLVSLPKMKTHHLVGATLAMKNLFGLVPGGVYGWPKNPLHWSGIPECIAALHAAFPRQFCLVDGIVAMEGNGPIQGTSKAAGVLIAGSDPVAVDATACRVMGLEPAKVSYIAMTASNGQAKAENIEQIGTAVHSVATRFDVIPEFRSLQIP